MASITAFSPGHDARLFSDGSEAGRYVNLAFEFDHVMDCDSVTKSLSIDAKTQAPEIPYLVSSSVSCVNVTNSTSAGISGSPQGNWRWSGTIANANDGIYQVTVASPSVLNGGTTTGVSLVSMRRAY